MQMLENVSLKQYSTMRLGGDARYCVSVSSEAELLEAIAWADKKQLRIKVCGLGSNIIWGDDGFDGLVIVMAIKDFEIIDDEQVRVGAGNELDETIARTVEAGLSGLETLSYIPGTVGAIPVQNVGAYGQEISKILLNLRAYDLQIKDFVELKNADCAFGFRTSRFKTTDKDRFIITSIILQLSHQLPTLPFYESLQRYLNENKIDEFTPKRIRNAVIAIRTDKLPDPFEIANNGSFFINPVIDVAHYEKLKLSYPDIKAWEMPNGRVKIAAGWLIEQSGFKDYHDAETGMATWAKQALVLINEHSKTTKDLLAFKQKIVDAVETKFALTLEQEPELVS